MPEALSEDRPKPFDRLPHLLIIPAVLALSAALAITSLLQDSMTFDEPAHLTAGFSYWVTGDYRLQPEHPPLAKMLATLPLLAMETHWPGESAKGWHGGDFWDVAQAWFDASDANRLITAARLVMVAIFLATCLAIYAAARTLFGRTAGLLAMTLAAFSPTLLAHGRIVGNDVPGALVILLTLLTYARVLERLTPARVVLTVLAFAALPLVKFSWMVIVPALLLMTLVAVAQPQPPGTRRIGRALKSIALLAGLAVAGWLAIWTCYGWSYSAFRGADRDTGTFVGIPDRGQPPPLTRAAAWKCILHDNDGRPAVGLLPALVHFARDHRLLPEAYLYGLAQTVKFTASKRPAYMNGECYNGGRAAYFPLVFALKTAIPVLLLVVAGVLAIVFTFWGGFSAGQRSFTLWDRFLTGQRASGTRLLLIGLATFAVLFAGFSITSDFNIGQRHLLPFYVVAFTLAGASAAWLNSRAGRVLVLAAFAWLAVANVRAWPNYLAYFNEIAGGPDNGYHYVADSNVDWGQNAKRVARYAAAHPEERIKLSYFGSIDPRLYVKCELLPSLLHAGSSEKLTPGTYIISINQLLGIYDPVQRQKTWADPRLPARYRQLSLLSASPDAAITRPAEYRMFLRLRWGRLLIGLLHRPPDERIGHALFVYRLSQEDIERLTRP